MKKLLSLALAASLSACATLAPAPVTPGQAPAPAPIAVTATFERVEAAYGRIRRAAGYVLPWLPAPYALRVTAAIGVADQALAAARLATDVAEQLRALRRVETAAAEIAAATGE